MTEQKVSIPSAWARDYVREREGVLTIRWTWVCMG